MLRPVDGNDQNVFRISPVPPGDAPLADRLVLHLRTLVERGMIAPGARLPNEHRLAKLLQVSRVTLREGLSLLKSAGLVQRRPGIGTIVSLDAVRHLQQGLEELIGISETLRRNGFRPGTAHAEMRIVRATPDIALALNIAHGQTMVHLSRTRLANDTPVSQSEDQLPLEFFESSGADPKELLSAPSLFWFLSERLKLEIVSAETEVVPCVATPRLADRLMVPRGHPLLMLYHIHLTASQRPIMVSRNYGNPDLIKFRLTRRRTH